MSGGGGGGCNADSAGTIAGSAGTDVTPSHGLLSSPSSSVADVADVPDLNPDHAETNNRTAVAWLRSTLRLSNPTLNRASALGADGLAVVYAWTHGPGPPSTPSQAFECAAAGSLDAALRERWGGSGLAVLRAASDEEAARKVAELAVQLNVGTLVVDAGTDVSSSENGASGEDDISVSTKLRDTLDQLYLGRSDGSSSEAIEIVSVGDGGATLTDPAQDSKALGRARFGGRVLRWPVFLKQMSGRVTSSEADASTTATSLPPHLSVCNGESLPDPMGAGSWAKELLERWGDISEAEALRRAESATTVTAAASAAAVPAKVPVPGLRLGEGRPPSTLLSPYLRWGVLSPHKALQLGVRERDLLWRDWSYVCYRRVTALRKGDPVVEALDGCCRTEECEGDEGGGALALWGRRAGTDDDDESTNEYSDEELAFAAWCTGRTGAPLVDAGMRQLWREGWMPRRLRLLSACCLVEGMGLDWRRGRDWFEHTLIDHDPAINELMWQNAGLCGIDPFYARLRWEVDDGDEGGEIVPGDPGYVERWTRAEELVWPSGLLRHAAGRKPPQREEVRTLAEARRKWLHSRGVYRAAKRVAMSGVRVAWEGRNSEVPTGKVLGIGRTMLESLDFGISSPE